MEQLTTKLDGPLLFKPFVHRDLRGYLLESYRRELYSSFGIAHEFVQDNHSRSVYGVVRGMHFQIGGQQAKLIRCVRGTIVDVLVDIRPCSRSYRLWEAFEISETNQHILYCPPGFAHGFCALAAVCDVLYKCSQYYDPRLEVSFKSDDPDVAIRWPDVSRISSERDRQAPRLRDLEPLLAAVEWE